MTWLTTEVSSGALASELLSLLHDRSTYRFAVEIALLLIFFLLQRDSAHRSDSRPGNYVSGL